MIKVQISKVLDSGTGKFSLQVDLELREKELVAIYGDSGAGKTSILRMIAGLMVPDQGLIRVPNNTWFDSKSRINVPAAERGIGLVFQENALFPNMTVRQNLEYALGKRRDSILVDEMLESTGLSDLQHRKPSTLSGGQQRRASLARAVIRKPRILLLDEPLSSLDDSMRVRLQDFILDIHRRFELTIILVSHDIGEMYKMADTIHVLEAGMIVRSGSPADVFTRSRVSGKFRFTGVLLDLVKNDAVYVADVLAGNNLIKVIATSEEVKDLKKGDKVIVVSKAFNPMILKAE